jgi:hypothetical protein
MNMLFESIHFFGYITQRKKEKKKKKGFVQKLMLLP